ncbi:MAG TPA: glycosyltransferase family 39 protein, partial [Acidimicrobiales bacterium]
MEATRPTPVSRHFVVVLLLILTLTGAVRVSYIFAFKQDKAPCAVLPPDNLCGDALVYHEGANLLADGKGFIAPPRYLYGEGDRYQSADHPPLYTVYLAAFSFVGLSSVLAHQLATALLGLVGVVMIALLGRELRNERTGLMAAALAGIWVNLWISDGLVMSETSAVMLTAALLWRTYRFWREPTLRDAIIVGAVGGLTALTRAELILYLPLVAIAMTIRLVPGWRGRLRLLGGMTVAGALVIAPWVVRNLTTFEEPVLLSTGLGITLAYTNCDPVYHGDLIGYWFYPCAQPIPLERDQSLDEKVFRQRATKYVKAHKSRVPLVVTVRVLRQWSLFRPDQHTAFDTFEDRERTLSRIGLLQYYVAIPFAVGGLVVLRRRRIPVWPLLAVGVIVTFAAALTYGNTRFRSPFDVVLVTLTAVALDRLWSSWRSEPS